MLSPVLFHLCQRIAKVLGKLVMKKQLQLLSQATLLGFLNQFERLIIAIFDLVISHVVSGTQ